MARQAWYRDKELRKELWNFAKGCLIGILVGVVTRCILTQIELRSRHEPLRLTIQPGLKVVDDGRGERRLKGMVIERWGTPSDELEKLDHRKKTYFDDKWQ